MDLRSIMATKGTGVEMIRPDADLLTAAQRMRAKEVGALVVSEDGVHVDGLLSERDIVLAWVEHPDRLNHRTVGSAMGGSPYTARIEDPLAAVMAGMTRHRQRQVPVLDGGRLVGVVSIGDLMNHQLEEASLEVRVLRDIAIARS